MAHEEFGCRATAGCLRGTPTEKRARRERRDFPRPCTAFSGNMPQSDDITCVIVVREALIQAADCADRDGWARGFHGDRNARS